MIKAVLFDLDGVLTSTKELHYLAFNKALERIAPPFIISQEDQTTVFEGLSTRKKIQILNSKGLNESLNDDINSLKQSITSDLLQNFDFKCNHAPLFNYLKKRNLLLALCTNSIAATTCTILNKLKIFDYFDLILTNESVSNPKPDSEIYLSAIKYFHLKPEQCLILEDSPNGIKAAEDSNAFVKIVHDIDYLNPKNISRLLNCINRNYTTLLKFNLKTLFLDKGRKLGYGYRAKHFCVECGKARSLAITEASRNTFSGKCGVCSSRKGYVPNRHDRQGYIVIPAFILPKDKEHIWRSMLDRSDKIREHRLVMALHLNRSLYSYEIVHHKNGIKDDNSLDNLELLTIKTHHKGHGDIYYQKWQEAESKIKELESKITELSK